MNAHDQKDNEQARMKIIRRLRRIIVIKTFFGIVYRMLNDYGYGISWSVTILTPFAFAAVLYLPNVKEQLGLTILIATAIGTLLSLMRSVFRFSDRAKHVLHIKEDAIALMNEISLGLINDQQLVERLKKLGLSDIEEPVPF